MRFEASVRRDSGRVKSRSPILFSLKGTNSIAGGTAPGCQQPFDQPCKGLQTPMGCNPLQGWSSIRSLPWAVPTAIEFVPFGDEIGRRLSFDTASRGTHEELTSNAHPYPGAASSYTSLEALLLDDGVAVPPTSGSCLLIFSYFSLYWALCSP